MRSEFWVSSSPDALMNDTKPLSTTAPAANSSLQWTNMVRSELLGSETASKKPTEWGLMSTEVLRMGSSSAKKGSIQSP